MTTHLKGESLALILAIVCGAFALIAVFRAWLDPAVALALLGNLSLCQ